MWEWGTGRAVSSVETAVKPLSLETEQPRVERPQKWTLVGREGSYCGLGGPRHRGTQRCS